MKELLAKRAQLIQRQRALLDGAKAEGRDLTEAEANEFETIETQIQSLESQIEREKIVSARMQDLDRPADQPYRPGPANNKKDDGGFSCLGEFIAAVRFGDSRGRIKAADLMQMGDGASGGFAVPEQFREELLMLSPEEAIVRPRATVIPAGDPPDAKLTIPALDQSRGIYGGVTVSWIAEGGVKPQTDAKLREVSLEPKEVAGHVVVTDKLLRNWSAANSVIRNLLRGAVISTEDLAFLTGDGVGKPLGVLNGAGVIAVHRAEAGKIQYVDIANMLAALLPDAVGNAVWIANQSTMPQIMTLKDVAGNSIFIQGDATKRIPATLAGIPIRWTGKTPALGSKGDLMLVDFRYYLVRNGSGPYIAASEHVHFTENKTVIKIFWNVDGQPWVNVPLTLEDGATRVSPYVVLDVPAV